MLQNWQISFFLLLLQLCTLCHNNIPTTTSSPQTSSPLCQLHVAAGLAIDMEVDATGGGDVSKFEDMWHTEDMLVQASFMN